MTEKELQEKKELQIKIGQKIKSIREDLGIEAQRLASRCDIEKSTLSRLEAGNTNPTIYTLSKIAKALDIELQDLVKI